MTKKDYELIADGIAETYANRLEWYNRVSNNKEYSDIVVQAEAALKAIQQVAADISANLREENPAYRSDKFMSRAIFNVRPMR